MPPSEVAQPAALVPEPPDGRTPFLAFVADEPSEAALRGGLIEVLNEPVVRRGDIRAAIRFLEKEAPPRVVLVDVAGAESPQEELERLAQVCSPDVKVLVIGERADIGFYRDLVMGLGVTDYLAKPLTRDSVERTFVPHIAGLNADFARDRGGQIIAVMGARGGAGATTVAVNLAAHLSAATHAHVAVLDLHLWNGATALMFDAKIGSGLRVALEEPERVDGLFLDRASVEVGERLRLIATEEVVHAEVAPRAEAVAGLLNLLRLKFNYVVIDLPLPPTQATRQVLTRSRHRVVVLGPDIVSIRNTIALRQLCTQLGVPRIITVLNRLGAPGTLKVEMVRSGIDGMPDVSIPDLSRQLPRSVNLGKVALHSTPALKKALAPLGTEISGVGAPGKANAKRSLWSWTGR